MKRLLLAMAIALSPCTSVIAAEPTFDCNKASSSIEKLICSDKRLKKLDRKLNDVYQEALRVIGGVGDKAGAKSEINRLKATQRGWIKGRDECWKARKDKKCAVKEYKHRIAELIVRYSLEKGKGPVFYYCNGNKADEIVATFYNTNPKGVRLERGDKTIPALKDFTIRGDRYNGEFGTVFWVKRNHVNVEWPQGTKFKCRKR